MLQKSKQNLRLVGFILCCVRLIIIFSTSSFAFSVIPWSCGYDARTTKEICINFGHNNKNKSVNRANTCLFSSVIGNFDDNGASSVPAGYGLYEVQEEMITKRGEFEEELMANCYATLEANKPTIKGANAAGGFGKATGKNSKSSSSSSTTSSSALKAQGKEHAKILKSQGVVRIDNVLPPAMADKLRDYVFKLRAQATEEVQSNQVASIHRFADVLLRHNRCDLTMPLNENIYIPLYQSLCQSAVGATIRQLLGSKATLYELSCLISDPGSQRQVVHPDTPYLKGQEAVLYTCFMALQDITLDMGPTCWIPGTHTEYHHAMFQNENKVNEADALSPKDKLLKNQPAVLGVLSKGACAIFDSRLLHCGTANKSLNGTSRALFYCSFKSPKVGYPGNPASIRPELAGKLTLESLTKDLELFDKGKGMKQLDSIAKTLR